ncbi:carbohydrate ABC transporter permease [Paenibacillus sp. CF384]|uniref:carbohydrate ABC transporter permease n=1 Tax=Paenibacillus sp. CF384 TaxID=1884382 RepID=UPI0008998C5B|nr:carbohydrate ABC transporter permease [Paenibacillus sp. CF384]SDW77062.1 putative aldouronate transport system permease protein [Paenibacillus sp. CF384]
MYYKTTSYRIFTIFNSVFIFVLGLCCILPLIHILAVSFSDKAAVTGNLVNFLPIGFNWDAYHKSVDNPLFLKSLWISFERVVLGTMISMGLVILSSYPLSKDSGSLRGRMGFMWYFIFTMLFSGGLVPTYFLISKLHMNNTIWVLVLPGAVSVWNMILLMNFFRNVPKELEEAALIDGANQFQTLWKIYLPVSMPALATLSLFTLVGHWNSWFDGLMYMTRPENYPLATYLQTIVVSHNLKDLITNVNDVAKLTQRSVQAAQIFIAAVPVLIVYPFLQRHFVKGMVLGAVKE